MSVNMLNLPVQPPIYQDVGSLPVNANNGATAVVLTSPPGFYIFENGVWDLATGGGESGVIPSNAPPNEFCNGINSSGQILYAQPSFTNLAGTCSVAQGGTGINSYTIGDILYASNTTTLSKLSDVATGNALISGGVGVAPSWGKIDLTTHVSSILQGANGGTGAANTGLTINLAGGAVGKVLTSDVSGNATWSSLSGLGVTSITGTTSQVLANGVAGSPQTGAVTLTLPQSIATTSSPQFNRLGINEAVVSSGSRLYINGDQTFADSTNKSLSWNADNSGIWRFYAVATQYAFNMIATSPTWFLRTSTTQSGAGNPITWRNAMTVGGGTGNVAFGTSPDSTVAALFSLPLLPTVPGDFSNVRINGTIGYNAIGGTFNALYVNIIPSFSTNPGTITTAYGLKIDTGSTSGTITTGYSLHVAAPTYGTTKYTAYFDSGVYIGAPSSLPVQLYVTGNYSASSGSIYALNVDSGLGASSGTVSNAYHIFVNPTHGNNVGTITNAYGLAILTGNTAGIITNGYGAYISAITYGTTQYGLFVNRPTGGTNKYTAYLDLNIGIGGTPNAGYGCIMGGTLTANDGGGSAIGHYVGPTFSPTSNTTSIYGIYTHVIRGSSAGAVTNSHGIYITPGSNSGGVPTTSYGLKVDAPGFGTNRHTAVFGMGTTGGLGIGVNPTSVMNISASSGTSQYWIDWRGTHTIVASSFSVGFNYGPTIQPASSCSAVSFDLNPLFNTSSANITTAYGLIVEALSNAGGGTITNAYGLFVARPTGSTNKYTAYFDNIIGIGSTPAANVGIWNGGGITATSASAVQGFRNSPTLGCTSGTMTNCFSMYNYADFTLNSATISNAFGLYIDVGGSTNTITTGFGLYVTYPAYGTTRYCADLRGNLRVGQDRSAQPNLDLTIIASTASSSAVTGGSAQALPANPVGYIGVIINGNNRAIPYYAASFY